jgi:hypothetical protein
MFAKSLRVWYECGGDMAARVSLERNSKEANMFKKKKKRFDEARNGSNG